jgi:hypothetical protein
MQSGVFADIISSSSLFYSNLRPKIHSKQRRRKTEKLMFCNSKNPTRHAAVLRKERNSRTEDIEIGLWAKRTTAVGS